MAAVIRKLWKKTRRLSPRARYGIFLVCILGVLYALLQNGHWTPGADSEIYLVAARNLLAGRGFQFNGISLGHYPPGWPLFLAGVMAISPSFWVLNAVAKALLLAAALLFYFTLTRYTPPPRAFVCAALSATLWHWFRYGYVLMSESLFVFLVAAALLTAMRVKEGRANAGHIGLLLLICVILPVVRWIGVVLAGVVGLAAASGEFRPRLSRRYVSFVLVCTLSLCSFGLTHWLVHSGALIPDALGEPPPVPDISSDMVTRKQQMIQTTALVHKRDGEWYRAQATEFGTWLSRLVWPAAKLGRTYPALNLLFNLVGLTLFLPYLRFTWDRLREKEWLWLGLLLYLGCLATTVAARGRYLAPVAPLFLLAIWAGGERVCGKLEGYFETSAFRRTVRALPAAFLAFVLLCNLVVYTVAVYVQRSPDFYRTFRAGQCRELVDAAHYISQRAPADATIAVSPQRKNLGRVKTSRGPLSALALLTDRKVLQAPSIDWQDDDAYLDLIEWAPKADISYLLVRPPTAPWRLWHFQVPLLQQFVTGRRTIEKNPFWVCYRVTRNGTMRIHPRHIEDFPSRVPPVVDRSASLDAGVSPEAHAKGSAAAENASSPGRKR